MAESEKSPRPEPVLTERERVVLQSYLNRNTEQIPHCPKGKLVYVLSERNIERLEEEFAALKAGGQAGSQTDQSKPRKPRKITFSRCRRLEREGSAWQEVGRSIKRSGIRAFNIVGEGVLLAINVPECILRGANLGMKKVNVKLESVNTRLSQRSVQLTTSHEKEKMSSDLERLCRRMGLSPHELEVEICRLAQEKNRKKVQEWSAGRRSDSDSGVAFESDKPEEIAHHTQ